MKRLLLPAALAVLALAGCASLTDAPLPEIRALELVDAGPLVRVLELELERDAPVEVEYWSDEGPRLRVRSEPALRHELTLARLRAGRTYHFEIVRTGRRESFETGPLPEALSDLELSVSGASSFPLVLLHVALPGESPFRGYVIVDGDGHIVWYWETEGFPYGMTRRQGGNFVFLDGDTGLREVTPTREVVAELAQDPDERELHHDVVVTPENSLLVIAFDTREWEGSPLKGEAIWEWWPETGRAVRRWSSWDHFSPHVDRGPRFGTEWMHANGLAIGPRGNVLVSVHYFDQVLSIAPGWEEIEWRLGGVNATIAVPEEEQFSGQHTPAEVSPGRVILFDNRHEWGGYSRAVEFELTDDVAQRAWEWRSNPNNFAFAVSSARRLANGNTLIGFGMEEGLLGSSGGTEVYEVTPGGDAVWHLRVGGARVMYRAEPLLTIAGE